MTLRSTALFVPVLVTALFGGTALAGAQQTSSIATVAPQTAASAKLATRTEIVADKGEAAMLTASSVADLQGAISMYEDIASNGGWPEVTGKKLQKGAKGPTVITLRKRLIAEGYLAFEAGNAPHPEVFDAEMVDALQAFQTNHGIAPTGSVGDQTLKELNVPVETRLATLRENLPRVEAYSKGLEHRNILVNIPSLQLETVENGQVYSRHNIVAGKVERPSPSLASKVSDVTFNPYWNAPASIVEKDIIPHYLKDPNYLKDLGIHVFDGPNGAEVDPTTIDWANTPPERYAFRQDPGDQNALATVKINFPNKFMVYMHDTPHRELFGRNARYESSGCIRIDQVKTVINWVLKSQPDYNASEYDNIIASRETYQLKVDDPPQVRFMYMTAWATDDGAINFRPDTYGLDGTGFVFGQPEPKSF